MSVILTFWALNTVRIQLAISVSVSHLSIDRWSGYWVFSSQNGKLTGKLNGMTNFDDKTFSRI